MKNILFGILIGVLATYVIGVLRHPVAMYLQRYPIISPLSKGGEKPLEKYEILRLSGRTFNGSEIVFDKATATTSAYTVYTFYYLSDGKKVTGVAHMPNDASAIHKKPVIVQFRGYVDRTNYTPGEGTRHSAEVYAKNGFISLAPDFLGYGGSDMPSSDVFEERFETYTAALNLIASVKTVAQADSSRMGIWGHSNGGQIALTALEVLAAPYPLTLWAPVTKPFPYSILYFTDDAIDRGKLLRKKLADFEASYDGEKYSLTNYLDRLVSPILIHQGTADDAVPQDWSDDFVRSLKDLGKPVTYYVYSGADHNMLGGWNTVVARDIEFIRKQWNQ